LTSELRWNPILLEWIIVNSNRKDRYQTNVCPFCPNSPEMKGRTGVVVLENKYPPLVPSLFVSRDCGLYRRISPSIGHSEIVVEIPNHTGDLCDLSDDNLLDVLKVFIDRYDYLGSKDYVKYVHIFRNKGEEVGSTLFHPHTQIYALPFIPPVIEKECESAKVYQIKYNKCLFCDVIQEELSVKERVIFSDDYTVCFIPFFAQWAYETHIYPKCHVCSLSELSDDALISVASSLKKITKIYNSLFGFSMPYVMVFHQKPTCVDFKDFHFHIEIYPVYQAKDKLKYCAGIERVGTFEYGAGTPEEKAEELRNIWREIK